jgi:protein-tyrosine phosphatase
MSRSRLHLATVAGCLAGFLAVAASGFEPIEVEPRRPGLYAMIARNAVQAVANGHNLQLVDDSPNGFALYRSGVPKRRQFQELCELGVRELLVMSGNADLFEARYAAEHCPEMKIVYDEKQREEVPLTVEFLEGFDRWIDRARAEGVKVLFRCDCGCHRTGRLAAYYRMKYNDYTVAEAIAEMNELGYRMGSDKHRSLPLQVRALGDFIDGRECTQAAEYCVRTQ